ncbi:hypothetical protein CANMA_000800 [Candida margitis]|uniref:uncharacterized protein n=1 Tax=Candida margitis TaxID=1775924 RepID=UPI0022274703|nr:uncharacterized protein CANMA_000800 [Candida margitis]KAI5970189.1 hypothetical protein CANMA_000800 [Candida margitis]
MDTPIGIDATIGSDFSLENQDELAQFSQLDSLGDSEQGSTTVQLPDPISSSVSLSVSPQVKQSTPSNQKEEQSNQDKTGSLNESDKPIDTNQAAQSDKMDIDTPAEGTNTSQLNTDLEPAFKAAPNSSLDKTDADETNANEDRGEDDPLEKIKQVQLLPEIYSLLFDVSNGKIQPRDFDKHIGTLRSKLNNLRSYISEVEGIDVAPETMMREINWLKENNLKKQNLLSSFRDKVRNDFV